METWQATLVLFIAAAVVAAAMRSRAAGDGAHSFRKRALLSGAESRLFDVLRAEVTLPAIVLAQVRLADVIEPAVRDAKARHAAFRMISQKHLDFAIYDTTRNAVLLAIELDGPTHEGASRRKADATKAAALASAEVPLVKLDANEAKQRGKVRERLVPHLSSAVLASGDQLPGASRSSDPQRGQKSPEISTPIE